MKEDRFTSLLGEAWGTEDVSVLQSMALLKPPCAPVLKLKSCLGFLSRACFAAWLIHAPPGFLLLCLPFSSFPISKFHILCANFLNFLELKASSCLDFRGHGEKFFHADQGYFRLYPSNVAAYWIALDTADETNGTMHGANVFNDLPEFQVGKSNFRDSIWIGTFMISMVVCSGAAVAHRWHPSPHAGRLRAARRRRARHRCPCELPTHTFF